LNPQNSIWRDLPALNAYVTRCQSMLQATMPDNDVLLYWPIHDLWQNADGLRMDLRVHNAPEWMLGTPFGKLAHWLDENGYAFDYVSDRQIATSTVREGRVVLPGGSYRTIIVPKSKYLPTGTARQLLFLANGGVQVLFHESLPTGPPGHAVAASESESPYLDRASWDYTRARNSTVFLEEYRRGAFEEWPGEKLETSQARRENWRAAGQLNFIRRRTNAGHVYLIRNESSEAFDDWITPAVAWENAVLMHPLDGRTEVAGTRMEGGQRQVWLKLAPGETVFLRTLRESSLRKRLPNLARDGLVPVTLDGEWSVEFIAGGPELPTATRIQNLESWTKFAGESGERFAGTVRFSKPVNVEAGLRRWTLDLGRVADSARVIVNGKPVATLITTPFRCEIELESQNELVVEVTNVAANRICDLDRRGVAWKIFKDINIVDINYRPLDASRWPIREAGLLGPVTIRPMQSQ
jgi:hypothetical protein